MTCSAGLSIVGGVLEITGFGLVAFDLIRVQRRELESPWPLRLAAWTGSRAVLLFRQVFRKTTTIESEPVELKLSGSMGVSGGSLELSTGPKSIEDRVGELEATVEKMQGEAEEHRAKTAANLQRATQEFTDKLAELERERLEREEEERSHLRTSLTTQWAGIWLFIAGAIFSAAANVVTC